MEQKLLSNKEAAKYLGLSEQTLHNWRHQRKGLNYHKIGRRVLYHIDDLNKYIESTKIIIDR
jgi:excisionase family DNA binding protein